MREFKIDFNKILGKVLIGYLAVFVVGIVMAVIFGIKLDINFSGGTKIAYSYTDEIVEKDVQKIIDKKDVVSTVNGDFILYKNKPLVREDNIICYLENSFNIIFYNILYPYKKSFSDWKLFLFFSILFPQFYDTHSNHLHF